MDRRRFFPLLVAACVATGSLDAGGGNTREEFRAAIRRARDGDLQADWNKMIEARDRFAALAANDDISALAHYYMGYTYWRLSSLAFVAIGPAAQGPLARRAVASLETAIDKRPQFPDAHALLAVCLATLVSSDPSLADQLRSRARAAWDGALPAGAANPRVMLLRAMSLTFAPPPYGDRQKGLALWRQAIELFQTDQPGPLMPDWGHVEAIAWLGGAHLAASQHNEAVVLLERAVRMRPDFWWAAKAALPIARRPILANP
jgi:tetratricopeptide (TPR) repeat protein